MCKKKMCKRWSCLFQFLFVDKITNFFTNFQFLFVDTKLLTFFINFILLTFFFSVYFIIDYIPQLLIVPVLHFLCSTL